VAAQPHTFLTSALASRALQTACSPEPTEKMEILLLSQPERYGQIPKPGSQKSQFLMHDAAFSTLNKAGTKNGVEFP